MIARSGGPDQAADRTGLFFHSQGSSSLSRPCGVLAIRAKTSASQACGSMALSFAVMISVAMMAARSAPRSEPAKSQALRPKAKPRSARSAELFVSRHR